MADAALPPLRRLVPSAIAFTAVIIFALALGSFADSGRDLALAALFGTAFGIVLQRSRFCFFGALAVSFGRIVAARPACGAGIILFRDQVLAPVAPPYKIVHDHRAPAFGALAGIELVHGRL